MKKMRMEINGMFAENALQVTIGMTMKEFAKHVVLTTVIFVPQSSNAKNVLMVSSFNMMARHVKKLMNFVQFLLNSTTSRQMKSHHITIVTNVELVLTLMMTQRVVNHVTSSQTVKNVQMQPIV